MAAGNRGTRDKLMLGPHQAYVTSPYQAHVTYPCQAHIGPCDHVTWGPHQQSKDYAMTRCAIQKLTSHL